MTGFGLRIIILISHVLNPTTLFMYNANPITECYFIALASAILCSVASYWIITWMSDHNIFPLTFLAKSLNEITASSISRTLTKGRYYDRRSQRRHYTRRCYNHAHKFITKGHHRLPRRLARVLLEKSPFHSARPSNSKSILSVSVRSFLTNRSSRMSHSTRLEHFKKYVPE